MTQSLASCCDDALRRLDAWRRRPIGAGFYERRADQLDARLGVAVSSERASRWDAQILAFLALHPIDSDGSPLDSAVRTWVLRQVDPAWRRVVASGLDCFDQSTATDDPSLPLPGGQEWSHQLDEAAQQIRLAAGGLAFTAGVDERDPIEQLLADTDRSQRTRFGVYFTPARLADFVLREVDRQLRNGLALPMGLADTTRWAQWKGAVDADTSALAPSRDASDHVVSILDPAAGSGIFLLRAIRKIRSILQQQYAARGRQLSAEEWTRYVARDLLPRVRGCELLPPAHVACVLNVALLFAEQQVQFADLPDFDLRLTNALDPPCEASAAGERTRHFTVIVGNPPFSGISDQTGRWIRGLLRGRDSSLSKNQNDLQARFASYYEVDDRPLGERKVWIDDDYVKFLRMAHWHVERQGAGVVGFVTNHGYIDNASFRGVRYQLLRTFCDARVVNLHGNAKRTRVGSEGRSDENVFEIEQGVAVSVFHKRPGLRNGLADVQYAELRGSRDSKLLRLSSGLKAENDDPPTDPELPWHKHRPAAPRYLFRPRVNPTFKAWDDAASIVDWMPLQSTVPVTARDHFITDRSRPRLLARLAEFADLSIPDDVIRSRYFQRSRSRKYPPGDTRGWKLREARQRMARMTSFDETIIECAYRPFEHRHVFWADWMIDWHRGAVATRFLGGPNLALLTRRQMLPDEPCDYFWVSDRLPLDGIIRSDNRGSESFFPLWSYDEQHVRQCNFCPDLAGRLAARLGRTWDPTSDSESSSEALQPRQLFHYIYALFHSTGYRERFAEQLAHEFPRVLEPASDAEFVRLENLGAQLIRAHTESDLEQRAHRWGAGIRWWGSDRSLATGFPRFEADARGGRILLNATSGFIGVPEAVWRFRVGSHHVCRKWLRDRRDDPMHADPMHADPMHADWIGAFRRVACAIAAGLQAAQQVDPVQLAGMPTF